MSENRGWHKSSYSNGNNATCVEVAEGIVTRVRDTQHRELGHLDFTPDAWAAFLQQVKDDRV